MLTMTYSRWCQLQVADLTTVAGEDAVSIGNHVRTMHVEFAKSTPNETLIHDRMMRTLNERRQDVTEMKLNEILEKYPALTLDCEVCKITVTSK